MTNLLVSYPNISEVDFNWIQDIRKNHDPRYYSIVKPHVTLIFGTDKLNQKELLGHVKKVSESLSKIAINFDSAIVVEDDSKSFFHTFLIPSEGFDQINKLHELLYEGDMSSELRLDIPFIPHIGIGTSDNEQDMITLTDQINEKAISIKGFLDTLTLIQFDGNKIQDLNTIILS